MADFYPVHSWGAGGVDAEIYRSLISKVALYHIRTGVDADDKPSFVECVRRDEAATNVTTGFARAYRLKLFRFVCVK